MLIAHALLVAAVVAGAPVAVCDPSSVPGVIVRVTVEGRSGKGTCRSAAVTATEGTHSEALRPTEDGPACRFRGLFKRPGRYDLKIEVRDHGEKWVRSVVVEPAACGVKTNEVAVTFAAPMAPLKQLDVYADPCACRISEKVEKRCVSRKLETLEQLRERLLLVDCAPNAGCSNGHPVRYVYCD